MPGGTESLAVFLQEIYLMLDHPCLAREVNWAMAATFEKGNTWKYMMVFHDGYVIHIDMYNIYIYIYIYISVYIYV